MPATARPRVSARWLEYALQAAVVGWLCLWLMPSPAMAEESRSGEAEPALSSAEAA
ncbi:MAG TPA: hypothetical protein VLA61_19825 [Ideonella sp.]|uniref:hypothetical protein n=1 Tax=Ideonella sp. TaxID=1929293 RepID=UPI002BBB70B7|nr:hypothetical protein [Ideonella sp.]HSI50522.1 hypothetical protein [Ideonella sp.]